MITIASSVYAARECSLFTSRADIAAIGFSSKYFHGHFKAVEPYGTKIFVIFTCIHVTTVYILCLICVKCFTRNHIYLDRSI